MTWKTIKVAAEIIDFDQARKNRGRFTPEEVKQIATESAEEAYERLEWGTQTRPNPQLTKQLSDKFESLLKKLPQVNREDLLGEHFNINETTEWGLPGGLSYVYREIGRTPKVITSPTCKRCNLPAENPESAIEHLKDNHDIVI